MTGGGGLPDPEAREAQRPGMVVRTEQASKLEKAEHGEQAGWHRNSKAQNKEQISTGVESIVPH